MHLHRTCRQWTLLASMLLMLLSLPARMRADSLRIVDLGSDQGRFAYGLDDAGTVVIDNSLYCPTTCYRTYMSGSYTGTSVMPPDLVFDNGSACPLTITGYVVQAAVCNNGAVLWTGYKKGHQNMVGVYSGLDPATGQVAVGGEGTLLLNSNGDLVWDDHFTEQIYEALVPTPEPGSVVLLATGLLASAAEGMRRRRHIGVGGGAKAL